MGASSALQRLNERIRHVDARHVQGPHPCLPACLHRRTLPRMPSPIRRLGVAPKRLLRGLALALAACLAWSTASRGQAPCAGVEQWRFSGHVCATPVIAQLTDDDGDGRVTGADDLDVAFWRRDDSDLGTAWTNFVLADARTGAVHADRRLFNAGSLGVAAGDADRDGIVDVVYTSGRAIARVSGGRVIWSVPTPPGVTTLPLSVGLADLDQDGDAEIHVGHVAWSHAGAHLWTGSRSSGGSPGSAADVDPASPGMELVVGRVLYAADGRVLWEAETPPEGATAVGDFDGDLEPEILLVAHEPLGDAAVTVLDRHGTVVGVPIPLGARAEYGPILADLDGDGAPEAVVIRLVVPPAPTVHAFKWESGRLVPFWETGVGRGPISPTAFDFDGDGRSEVVLADELGVVILDGLTGAERARLPNASVTQGEIAVVADIEGDGITEVFSPACGNTVVPPDPALLAFECASSCVARAAWNQSAYRIGNVGDDGSIPRFEPPPWLTHGSWGAQAGTGPCDVHCDAAVAPLLADASICFGDTVRLDASGHGFGACGGAVVHRWTDESGAVLGTDPILDVTALATARYRVDVTCASRPRCRLADAATVTVTPRPVMGDATAADLLRCNRGVEITWPEATFTTPAGGAYRIFRSDLPGGGTCADAVANAPLAEGLAATGWIDATTIPGVAHVWVVEAEDAAPAGPCLPAGPGGGAVARSCTAAVVDAADASPPDGVFAVLRASHDGDLVEMRWPDARPLLADEHFHLLKAWGMPTSAFSRVNPEADTGASFAETDASSPRQFFDLRVASACEQESIDEYPPGWDR